MLYGFMIYYSTKSQVEEYKRSFASIMATVAAVNLDVLFSHIKQQAALTAVSAMGLLKLLFATIIACLSCRQGDQYDGFEYQEM
jgi:lipopolysaccharide export LptBFGC system permease protein LptF